MNHKLGLQFDNFFSEMNSQAAEVLRVIQLNTLEDRSVHDKQQWDSAVLFVEESVNEKLKANESVLQSLVGPSRTQQWVCNLNEMNQEKISLTYSFYLDAMDDREC